MKIIQIPVVSLKISEVNMRRDGRRNRIEELKASLLAHGQLAPIGVVKPPGQARGDAGYEVVYGGRRVLAAQELVAEGKWEQDAKLAAEVKKVTSQQAEELSLVENFQRVSPHPVDEFLAFARLVSQGEDCFSLAERFGKRVEYINQRLALGRLSSTVLDAFRTGRIPLKVCEALSGTTDHETQDRLLKQVLERPYTDGAQFVRNVLRQSKISARLAHGDALERYLKAGGTLTKDLFDDLDSGFIDDAALFLECQQEAVEAEAEELRKVRAFVDVYVGGATWQQRKLYEEQNRLAEEDLEELVDDLKNAENDDDPDLVMDLKTEVAFQENFERNTGVVYVVETTGQVQVFDDRTRVVEEPITERGEPVQDKSVVSEVSAAANDAAKRDTAEPDEPDEKGARLSGAVSEALSAVRTVSLQHALLQDPVWALRVLCLGLLVPANGLCSFGVGQWQPPRGENDFRKSDAWYELDRLAAEWGKVLEMSPSEIVNSGSGLKAAKSAWPRLLKMNGRQLQDLMAFLVALRCRMSHGVDEGPAWDVASGLEVSVASEWRPDAAFLARLPKPLLVEAAIGINARFGREFVSRFKKAEMAKWLARCMAKGDEPWHARTANYVNEQSATLSDTERYAMAWLPPGTEVHVAVPAAESGEPEVSAAAE